MQPYLLLWLRYTAFIGLYPLGVASELAMVWLALPWIREHRPLSVQACAGRAGGITWWPGGLQGRAASCYRGCRGALITPEAFTSRLLPTWPSCPCRCRCPTPSTSDSITTGPAGQRCWPTCLVRPLQRLRQPCGLVTCAVAYWPPSITPPHPFVLCPACRFPAAVLLHAGAAAAGVARWPQQQLCQAQAHVKMGGTTWWPAHLLHRSFCKLIAPLHCSCLPALLPIVCPLLSARKRCSCPLLFNHLHRRRTLHRYGGPGRGR